MPTMSDKNLQGKRKLCYEEGLHFNFEIKPRIYFHLKSFLKAYAEGGARYCGGFIFSGRPVFAKSTVCDRKCISLVQFVLYLSR